MKNKIINKVPYTFFPTSTAMCKMFDLQTAVVFGRILSYCAQKGICYATKRKIGEEVGLSSKTVERRIKILLENKYIYDKTPGIRNHTHHYVITKMIDDIDKRWKEIISNDECEDEDLEEFEPEVREKIKDVLKIEEIFTHR